MTAPAPGQGLSFFCLFLLPKRLTINKQEEYSMRKGWLIAFAGTGLNLILGVIYAWSVFKATLVAPIEQGGYGWTDTMATSPYAFAIVVWAILMIPAGACRTSSAPGLSPLSAPCLLAWVCLSPVSLPLCRKGWTP
jgi:hypothetical protein